MRFSHLLFLALPALSLATPIDLSNIVTDVEGEVDNLKNSGATLGGIVSAIGGAIEDPALTVARLKVVKGLSLSKTALSAVNEQATATKNTAVVNLVINALSGLGVAQEGVGNIEKAILSGKTPSRQDQTNVAKGIFTVKTAVDGFTAAVAAPDATLTTNIEAASVAAEELTAGAEGVLSASGLDFADLGLVDPSATPASSSSSAPSNSTAAAPPASDSAATDAPTVQASDNDNSNATVADAQSASNSTAASSDATAATDASDAAAASAGGSDATDATNVDGDATPVTSRSFRFVRDLHRL